MRLRTFFLYIAVTLLLPVGVPAADGPPKSMVSSSGDMLEEIFSVLPDSDTKRGLKEYSETLSVTHMYGLCLVIPLQPIFF